MFKRDLFDDLIKYLGVFPVVGLLGPRNAGKTTLVKNTVKWFSKQSVYIDLEFGPDYKKLENPGLYFDTLSDHCIVIDEIQKKHGLLRDIRKSTEDHQLDGMFLIVSSSVSDKLKKNARVLSGKIGYLTLYPFNLLEVVETPYRNNLWLRGGYPESLLASNEIESFKFLDNLINTHCERDLPQLGLINDPYFIRSFLTMIATSQGEVWNASSYARSLGVTSPTVKKYLDFLEDVFLVTLVKPYAVASTKRLVKAPRIYIADSGILHTLLEIESEKELHNHIIAGSSWEGYVIAQIHSVLSRKVELFHYKTHQGAQIDLIITRNRKPVISIEIQTTNKPALSKGFRIAIDDIGTEKNFIVTPDSANYRINNKVEVIGLEKFLAIVKDLFITNKA